MFFCRHSTTVIFSSATKPHELLCNFTPSKSVMWFGSTGVLQLFIYFTGHRANKMLLAILWASSEGPQVKKKRKSGICKGKKLGRLTRSHQWDVNQAPQLPVQSLLGGIWSQTWWGPAWNNLLCCMLPHTPSVSSYTKPENSVTTTRTQRHIQTVFVILI